MLNKFREVVYTTWDLDEDHKSDNKNIYVYNVMTKKVANCPINLKEMVLGDILSPEMFSVN